MTVKDQLKHLIEKLNRIKPIMICIDKMVRSLL